MDDANPWLNSFVENSDDAIITKTLEGVIISWNPAAERLFGYPAAEAIGRPVAMLVPSDRSEEEPRILARIANGERVDHFETERIRKDGSVIAVSVTISPVRDAAGRLVGASKIARDISERKKADARVQAQLARLFMLDQITRAVGEQQDLRDIYRVALRAVEERLPLDFACMCAVDQTCHQLTMVQLGIRSARLADDIALSERSILALEPDAWARWTDGGLIYARDLLEFDTTLTRRLERGGFRSMVIAPLTAGDKVRSLMICARRQRDAFSSVDCEFILQFSTHVALAARHAELRASLQKANDELRSSQELAAQQQRLQALGEMASGVVHDIGNLVFPAAFYAQELKDREATLSQEGRKALALVNGCLADVAAIVERLKEFYRAREISLRPERVDLTSVIHQVEALTRPRCAQRAARGVSVKVESFADERLPAIAGSESEIREALVNLVLNALDAMPDGGAVKLRSRTIDGTWDAGQPPAVEVSVEDDGVGMDEDTRRRCMEPFFTTKGDAGTGMGLAMVYGTVRRHGADISIDSAPGKGTTVSIRFPYAHAPSTPAPWPAAEAPAATPATRSLRVLLVDDDPLVLETLARMLEMSGHAITAAGGGGAGIDAFHAALRRGEKFDVVVTDLGMPDIDGKAVARAIKRVSPGTPVVLLTGWGEGIQRNADASRDIDASLSKPTRRLDLEEILERLTHAAEQAS